MKSQVEGAVGGLDNFLMSMVVNKYTVYEMRGISVRAQFLLYTLVITTSMFQDVKENKRWR
jgi:hypothetical protein